MAMTNNQRFSQGVASVWLSMLLVASCSSDAPGSEATLGPPSGATKQPAPTAGGSSATNPGFTASAGMSALQNGTSAAGGSAVVSPVSAGLPVAGAGVLAAVAGRAGGASVVASGSAGVSAPARDGNAGFSGGGSSGSDPAISAGTAGSAKARPPCISDPSKQVALIGDSLVVGFAGSPPLQPALAALIKDAASYPNYAGAGCSIATGGVCLGNYGDVPAQFVAAHAAQPNLKFMIMDGGANDILVCDSARFPGCADICSSPGSSQVQNCKEIVRLAQEAAGKIMKDAANAGVKDIIYFFVPHVPGRDGGYVEITDYAAPPAKQQCDGMFAATAGKLTCHFLDLTPPYAAAGGDKNVANFWSDELHPSSAGQAISATQIEKMMKAECLGQPASSGCCEP